MNSYYGGEGGTSVNIRGRVFPQGSRLGSPSIEKAPEIESPRLKPLPQVVYANGAWTVQGLYLPHIFRGCAGGQKTNNDVDLCSPFRTHEAIHSSHLMGPKYISETDSDHSWPSDAPRGFVKQPFPKSVLPYIWGTNINQTLI